MESDVTAQALAVRGLRAMRGSTPVLRGVELDVASGEICALMGVSGAGKSTVLRAIAALQAFRLALPPMTNDFVALLKDSSLVSVITVVELTKQTAIYATNIGSWVVPGVMCALVYLSLSLPLSRFAGRLERKWSLT